MHRNEGRQVYRWGNKFNKTVNIHAIFREKNIYLTLGTRQIDYDSHMCFQSGTTANNTFNIITLEKL